MDINDIDYFYNFYKNSIGQIKKIEKRLIKESYSYQKWSELLHTKSALIRKIYEENRIMISKLDEEFTMDIAEKYISHIDFFISEGYRDHIVDESMLKKLIVFFEENNVRHRIFDTYHFLGLSVLEHRKFKEAVSYLNKALAIYDNTDECTELYRKFRITNSQYYMLIALVLDKDTTQKEVLNCVYACKKIWIDEPILDFVTPKKELGFIRILNNLVCHFVERLLYEGYEITDEMYSYIKNAYEEQLKGHSSDMRVDNEIYVIYYRLRYLKNDISYEEYENAITKKYVMFNVMNSTNFEYGTNEFLYLFDDETLDEDFAVETLFFMNPSINYIYYLIPEVLKINDISKEEIIEKIIKYYKCLPVVSGNYMVDCIIENNIKRIADHFSVNEFVELTRAIFITRQATTEIHNNMVSKIATTITSKMLEKRPDLFCNTICSHNEEEVLKNKELYLDFVDKSARLHDLGKITCSDIINLQIRKIDDEEFAVIKKHPEAGAQILSLSDELKPYKDIALLHHKSFDGKSGYPANASIRDSKYSIFVDIIKICDCIDAATDALGRNYANSKDFYTVLSELKDRRGEYYSDVVVDMLDDDEELKKTLNQITGIEREMTYYDIYRNLLEPTVNFRPMDEKFVRAARESDMDEIATFSNEDKGKTNEFYEKYGDCFFVICDGYGKIYGYSFAVIEDTTINVKNLFIKKDFRRQGNGTMLLEFMEEYASKLGCKKIRMPLIVEGHNDKFCFRRNFNTTQKTDVVEKEIQ